MFDRYTFKVTTLTYGILTLEVDYYIEETIHDYESDYFEIQSVVDSEGQILNPQNLYLYDNDREEYNHFCDYIMKEIQSQKMKKLFQNFSEIEFQNDKDIPF